MTEPLITRLRTRAEIRRKPLWWERLIEWSALPFILVAVAIIYFPFKAIEWLQKRQRL